MSLSAQQKIQMLYQLLLIHRVEKHMESIYHLDQMKTPIHLCIGQEAIAVGICACLETDDYIQSNHRSHGHYLAKGGDLKKMIAELYCRETGCSRGRGGSMHLVDTSVGHLGSSSIVGGGIPIGTGLALASKLAGDRKVSVVFFGDGAADEGTLYESINFAVLKQLPVIYVLEDNSWAVCSHRNSRQAMENIFLRAKPEHLVSSSIDGNDLMAVYNAGRQAVQRARAKQGPTLIECKTYRVRGHAGSYSDAHLGYRPQEEIAYWEEQRCPVKAWRDHLLEDETLSQEELREMERRVDAEIREAFDYAQKSPLPAAEDLGLYLYKEADNVG